MDVPRDASSLILLTRLVDSSGDAITDVDYDDTDLTVESRAYGESSWTEITLAEGTLGTYVENGWTESGNGEYEFCPSNDLVVAGRVTWFRVTYAGNPVQYGSINAVGASGSSVEAVIVPVLGVVQERVEETTIQVFTKETLTVAIGVVDVNGDAVNVEGMTLTIVIEKAGGVDKAIIEDDDITKSSNTLTFAIPAALSATKGRYRWVLRRSTGNEVLLRGPLIVDYAPQADT